jgi:sulfatase maturation enzyme AslB (radical SAM superfamily)
MTPETAECALRLLSRAGASPVLLELTGGEPLMAKDLALRCIRRFRSFAGAGSECVLATNGFLLDEGTLDVLEDHDVTLALSFDGSEASQDLRAPESAGFLEGLLGRIRRSRPEYFLRRVRLSAVLLPETVPRLAESCRRLAATGAARIRLQPALGSDRRWKSGDEPILHAQMAEAAREAAELYRRTGTVPLAFLGPGTQRGSACEPRSAPCNVLTGRALFVDAGGEAWTCPLLALSVVRDRALVEPFERAVRVGPITSPDLGARRAAALSRAASSPGLGGEKGGGSDLPCAACAAVSRCRICPASRLLSGGPGAPAFACAFERAAALARERFEAIAGPLPGRRLSVALSVSREWRDRALRRGDRGGIEESRRLLGRRVGPQ